MSPSKSSSVSLQPGIQNPLVWIGCILLTLVALEFLRLIFWLALPTLFAVIFYYLSYPVIDYAKSKGYSHDQAIWVLLGALILILPLGAAFLGPWVTGQILNLQEKIPAYVNNGEKMILNVLHIVEVKLPWLVRGGFSEQAKVKLEASSSSFVDEHLEEIVGFLLAWVPSLLLVPVLTFFMLRDGASLKKLIMQGVPNAFFEKVLLLLHRIDVQIKNYFRGMLLLTLLDTVTLALGLWILGWIYGVFGLGDAIALGLFCAILSWMPFIGSVLGAILVILICATEAAGQPQMALYAGILFALVRLLDDFVYTPMTVGKSMSVHPFLTIMIIFCGGVFSGVPGLILAMPVLGITIVLGDIFEEVWFDERLRARHQHARLIHKKAAWSGLDPV